MLYKKRVDLHSSRPDAELGCHFNGCIGCLDNIDESRISSIKYVRWRSRQKNPTSDDGLQMTSYITNSRGKNNSLEAKPQDPIRGRLMR